MATPIPSTTNTPLFTPAEQEILGVLRARYEQDRDMFNADERARLRFIRWLYRTGRLVP